MFFTRLAYIAAVLALLFGALRLGIGLYVASIEPAEARYAAQTRYIGSKSSGQAVDQGIYVILIAIALGTMAEISRKRSP